MSINDEIKPGQPILAETVEEIRRIFTAIDFTVVPPLEMIDTPNGRHLRLGESHGFWAKVYGNGPAYTWSEVKHSGDDYDFCCREDGEETAYEANGVTGLNGTVQWLVPGPKDWRFQAVKKGSPPVTPPACTNKFTVYANTACRSTGQPGVLVTVTKYPSGEAVTTGTTDSTGKVEFELPRPGPGEAYENYRFQATYKGQDPYMVYGDGSQPGTMASPKWAPSKVVKCNGVMTFAFDSFNLRVYVNGCQFQDQPGASIEVYKATYTTPSTRAWDLIGSGSSGGDGWADIELSKPNNRNSQILLKVEHGDFYQHLRGLDQFNGVQCQVGVSINQLGVPAYNFPDLPGVDLEPRVSTSNAKYPTSCCNSLRGPKPVPGTLQASIGGYSCELTNHDGNGIWYGYFSAELLGRGAFFNGERGIWDTNCGYDSYYHTMQSVCVEAAWFCGGLSLSVAACNLNGTFVPLGVSCEIWRTVFRKSSTGNWSRSMPGTTLTLMGDPVLETGTCFLGPYTVSE